MSLLVQLKVAHAHINVNIRLLGESMNIIQVAGHLGADAETRFTATGQKVTSLRVATTTRKKDKEETIWWRVTVWGDRFEKMFPYLKKGSAVIVIGELSKPEIYTDKEGRPQVSMDITAEIIRFSPFGKADKDQGANPSHSNQSHQSNQGSQGSYEGGFNEPANANQGGFGGYGQKQNFGQTAADDNMPF